MALTPILLLTPLVKRLTLPAACRAGGAVENSALRLHGHFLS